MPKEISDAGYVSFENNQKYAFFCPKMYIVPVLATTYILRQSLKKEVNLYGSVIAYN
jgi:hypothetical protein